MKHGIRLLLAFLMISGSAHALELKGEHPFGAGLILGEPTGLALRARVSEKNAIHGYFEFIGKNINAGADFVWKFTGPGFVSSEHRSEVLPYIGAGAIVAAVFDNAGLGARMPFGVEWQPKNLAQLGFFFEIAPGVIFFGGDKDRTAAGAWGIFNIALGGVYYF